MRCSVLLSAVMHVLALVGVSLPLSPADASHLRQENASIRVFSLQVNGIDESLKAETSDEAIWKLP
jgi:hypothetical protein